MITSNYKARHLNSNSNEGLEIEMNLTDIGQVYSIIIPLMTLASVIYFVGVYFHVKIIQVSKKDKELTWKLDMTNYLF